MVLLHPVLGQGIAHAYRLQQGGVVNAGRGSPGLVAGGPDDVAFRVGQFPRSAQVVRVHMQGPAFQRLGGGFLRHHALQARLQFALQRQDLGVPDLVVIARFVQGLLHEGVAQGFVARLLVPVPEALHLRKRHKAVGLIKVEPVACRVPAVLVLQGVFGQQAVAVPPEVGDGRGNTCTDGGGGGGLFLLRRFLPFGYALAKEVICIKTVRLGTGFYFRCGWQ